MCRHIDDAAVREWVILRCSDVVLVRLVQTLLDHVAHVPTAPAQRVEGLVERVPGRHCLVGRFDVFEVFLEYARGYLEKFCGGCQKENTSKCPVRKHVKKR